MSATVVITAETEQSSRGSVQRILDDVKRDVESLGFRNVTVTHYRSESGVITPDGMGSQTVGEILTPTVDVDTDAAEVIDQLAQTVQAAQEAVQAAQALMASLARSGS